VATTADLRNGIVIEYKNDLYKVVDFQHVKPGKGGAFVRAKLKNIRTGKVLDDTWTSGATIVVVEVRRRPIQYLYSAGTEYHFMDTETYEQLELPKEMLQPYLPFMTESMAMESLVRQDDESTIDVAFPASVVLEVTEAHDAARGDSAGSVTKPVKVETGYELHVPPFISQGEKIRIDTTTGKYIERVN
jgi:elongation factor P